MSLHLAVNVWNHDWKQQRHNRVAMFMQFQNESIYYSLWIIRWDIWLMLWNLETETRELWRGIVKESRPLVRIINQYYFSTKEDYINMSWQTTTLIICSNLEIFLLQMHLKNTAAVSWSHNSQRFFRNPLAILPWLYANHLTRIKI